MKLSTREDIEMPIARVFERVSDFDAFERQLLRRGIDVTRHDGGVPRWRLAFDWRGRRHEADAELKSLVPGEGLSVETAGSGVRALGVVDLVALSRARTRMFVSLDLRPETLSARLLIQSLKIAKGNLSRRFAARVAEFARGVEERA